MKTKTGSNELLRRRAAGAHITATSEADGVVEGGHPDHLADVYAIGGGVYERIVRGAFAESIRTKPKIALTLEHDWDAAPIGHVEQLEEDAIGIRFRARIYTDNERGLAVYRTLLAGASSYEVSIAFRGGDVGLVREDGRDIEEVRGGRLIEIALTLAAANQGAELVSVRKRAVSASVRRRLERSGEDTFDRLVSHPSLSPGQRLAAQLGRTRRKRGETVRFRVATANEAAARVLQRAVVTFPTPPASAPLITPYPGDAELVDLVDSFTPTSSRAPVFQENAAPATPPTGRPYGVALDQVTVDWLRADTDNPPRIGAWAGPFSEALLDVPESITQLVDDILIRAFRRSLNRQMAIGDETNTGAEQQLVGILNQSGIGLLARGGDSMHDAVDKAVEALQTNEFAGPFSLVTTPADLGTYRRSKTVDDDTEPRMIENYVANRWLTADEALVGNFRDGAVVGFVDGLDVTITDKRGDDALKGQLVAKIESRVIFVVRRPLAFVRITGF